MVIFISGPLGSGKSTVAKILEKKMKRAAVVEPDALRAFIPKIPIDKAVPVVLEMTVHIIRELSRRRFNVIVPYPLSEKNYRFAHSRLTGIKTYAFVLSPQERSIRNGRGKRTLNNWERRRVRRHYATGLHRPSFGTIIDNTRLKPSETAKVILDALR